MAREISISRTFACTRQPGTRGSRVVVRLGVLTACVAAVLAFPAVSQAYWSQNFCGFVLVPGGGACSSNGPHSLDRSNSWYPGLAQHHVKTCTYLWNSVDGVFRGGVINCQWSDVGDGTAGVLFDATVTAKYYGRAYLHADTCCNHTVNAWTRTTF